MAGRRLAKASSVRSRDGLPIVGVDQIDTGAHDIVEGCAESRQTRSDLVKNEGGLPAAIAGADNLVRAVCRRGAADQDPFAHAHGAAVSGDRLEGAARGDARSPRPAFDSRQLEGRGMAIEDDAEVARGGEERGLPIFIAAVAGQRLRLRQRLVDSLVIVCVERKGKNTCRLSSVCRRSPSRAPTMTAATAGCSSAQRVADIGDRDPMTSWRRGRAPTKSPAAPSQPPAASTKRWYFILLQSAISPLAGSWPPEPALAHQPAGERPIGEQAHAVGKTEGAHLARRAAVEERESDLVGDDRDAVLDEQARWPVSKLVTPRCRIRPSRRNASRCFIASR